MIEIVKVILSPTARRLGTVMVRYHDIMLHCELVLYAKVNHEKLWIRMPKIWFDRTHRMQFAYFSDANISEHFQKVVLQMLELNHGIDLSSAIDLHKRNARIRKEIKKSRH